MLKVNSCRVSQGLRDIQVSTVGSGKEEQSRADQNALVVTVVIFNQTTAQRNYAQYAAYFTKNILFAPSARACVINVCTCDIPLRM